MNYYFLLTVQYDGTNYKGWAKQIKSKTIQGEIEKAIFKVSKNKNFHTLGASKTDSGVHALDQKVYLNLDFEPNIEGFRLGLNAALPRDIFIKNITKINKEFKVRDVKNKIYVYKINDKAWDFLDYRYEYLSKNKLDIKKLKESLELFVGEHNFVNFSGLKDFELDNINTIRTIDSIEVSNEDKIYIFFKAKGFIRYQIRKIVGTCIAYCENKITLSEIKEYLYETKRKIKYIANPEGLVLKEIKY